VDGREVTAAVEMSEVDGVEAVGLAAIAGLLRDQRGCDDLAVEAIICENPVEHEAGARRLVTGANRPLGRKTAEETSNLHEIAGQAHDLGHVGIVAENGGGNRILMNVETDPGRLGHGWIPPIEN
jgi:hypothetical protein